MLLRTIVYHMKLMGDSEVKRLSASYIKLFSAWLNLLQVFWFVQVNHLMICKSVL